MVLTLSLRVFKVRSDRGVQPHDMLLASHTHVLRRVVGVDVLRAKTMDQIAREPFPLVSNPGTLFTAPGWPLQGAFWDL